MYSFLNIGVTIFPWNFRTLQMKLRIKFSEKLKGKYMQNFLKISVFSKEIWKRLRVHTAFFISTGSIVSWLTHTEDLSNKKGPLSIIVHLLNFFACIYECPNSCKLTESTILCTNITLRIFCKYATDLRMSRNIF